jgi:hypothetical protein
MSDQAAEPEPSGFDLQKAQFDGEARATLECASCHQPIAGHYFSTRGAALCEGCKFRLEASLSEGSRVGRLCKAGLFGLAAAIVSAGIWMAVTELTGYEIGLVAIAVGFLVGQAVNIGSERRGGPLYQLIAVGFTYSAIVATYIPYVVQGLDETGAADNPTFASEPDATTYAPLKTTDTESRATGHPGRGPDPTSDLPSDELNRTGLEWLIWAMLVFAVAAAAPFLAGFDNLIGIFIIGLALWEAWRRNKRLELVIEGPFQLGAATP